MASTQRRRWFTYSLRTMFALFALLAMALGWLGAELRFVHERTGWRNRNDSNWPAHHYSGWKYNQPIPTPTSWWRSDALDGQTAYVPRWREWMGDVALTGLYFGPELSDQECERLYRLFPEAIFVFRTVRSEEELILYEYKPGMPLAKSVGSFDLR